MKSFVFKTVALSAALTAAAAFTAFAGQWQQDERGWRYQMSDEELLYSGWYWIDGNGDGIAESYCFNGDGYIYTDTVTPDGSQVNADGARLENGVVQTKEQQAAAEGIEKRYEKRDGSMNISIELNTYVLDSYGGRHIMFVATDANASEGFIWDYFGGVGATEGSFFSSGDGRGNEIEFTYDAAGNLVVTKCNTVEDYSFPGIEGTYTQVA